MIPLRTERLLLRGWTDFDRGAFANLNGDLRVMEFMPGALSREESDQLFEKIQSHIRTHGFGLYAAELLSEHSFIGYIGLAIPSFEDKFTPCVEIGWRLAAEQWNQGLATEGARAVVHYAFEDQGIPELVSFTAPANKPSRRVMETLGMTHDPAGCAARIPGTGAEFNEKSASPRRKMPVVVLEPQAKSPTRM